MKNNMTIQSSLHTGKETKQCVFQLHGRLVRELCMSMHHKHAYRGELLPHFISLR